MTPPENDQDPSGGRKLRREQARQQRKAQEAAAAAGAKRKRRLSQLGAVAAVVAVAIVVIVLATNGSKSPSEPSAPPTKQAASTIVSDVESELQGIPQSGSVLGKQTAPVTLQYYGDLECPFCREFTITALPVIIQKEVRAGKLKVEYKSLSTATGNAERGGAEPEGMFTTQQSAALAAGEQNLGWYYIELFYNEQAKEDSGYVTEGFLQSLAQQVPGLNLKKWTQARSDEALKKQVLADEKSAVQIGFEATPSFEIGKTGGKLKPFQPESLKQSSVFEREINKLAS